MITRPTGGRLGEWVAELETDLCTLVDSEVRTAELIALLERYRTDPVTPGRGKTRKRQTRGNTKITRLIERVIRTRGKLIATRVKLAERRAERLALDRPRDARA
jgi:hypothetical protein